MIFMHAGGVEIAEADCHWDLEWSRCHGPMAGMWQLEAVVLARDLKSSDVAGFHASHVVQRVFSHQK